MIKKGGLFAAAALVVLLATSHSFSFAPQSQHRCPSSSSSSSSARSAEQDNSQESSINSFSNRRGFLSQVGVVATASASLLLSSSPQQATAVSNDPTRIELSVDTEYMLRALEYFDGDMSKVMEVLIRAPSTEVEIEPPSGTLLDPKVGTKDAILRALSSYNKDPEYAARQISWMKVDKPNWTLDFLLKKRFDIPILSSGPGNAEEIEIVLKDGGSLKYKPMKLESAPLSLSNLEVIAGLAVASYPVGYGLYNFESWQEEKQAKVKKAQMTAKKAAKAKAAAAAKKAKGAPMQKNEKGGKDTTKKSKQVMKGQEAKNSDESLVDVNFDGKSEEWFLSETTLNAKIKKPKIKKKTNVDDAETLDEAIEAYIEVAKIEETEAPPADSNGDASNGSEWFGRDVSESAIMELVEEAEVVMQEIAQQRGYLDNLSPPTPKGQVVIKKSRPVQKGNSFGGYLDSLVQDERMSNQQQGGYLDNLSPPTPKRQATSKKQYVSKKSGSLGSYLDAL